MRRVASFARADFERVAGATTEHRLKETLRDTVALLPRQALVVLDPDRRLAVIHAALRNEHGEETVKEQLSNIYVSREEFQKSKRGPKRPQRKRNLFFGNGQHVATAKLLARRNN